MGSGDLDPYDSGGHPPSLVGGILRILVVLVGLAIAAYGLGLWVLRCFDTCPSDPSLDKVLMLLSAALSLTGLVVVIQAVSFRTRWADVVSGALVFVGGLIALLGIASLVLLPSVDELGSSRPSVVWPLAALLVGVAIAIFGVPGRGSSNGAPD